MGRARGLLGGPRMGRSFHLILEAGSLALATFMYLDLGFRLPVLMRPSHAAEAIEVLLWQGWEAKVQ